jgi:hypothetical protein
MDEEIMEDEDDDLDHISDNYENYEDPPPKQNF